MTGQEIKRVMVVYNDDGREAKYAHLLSQLISSIKSIESSQPIKESEYRASFLTIDNTADAFVIYFGNGKEAKKQANSVNWQYDKFGMKFGWLGKHCVVTADDWDVKLEEQNDFSMYYNSRVDTFKSAYDLDKADFGKIEKLDMKELTDEIELKKDDDDVTKFAKKATSVFGAPLIALAWALKGVNDAIQFAAAGIESVNLWKYQYELLTLEFVFNGFERFLNGVSIKTNEFALVVVYEERNEEYAYLLRNLIQQYHEYDVIACTDKIFQNDAKKIDFRSKIIFVGDSASAKLRTVALRKKYSKFGMNYGWFANDCFINASPLKGDERDAFVKYYVDKGVEYENKADEYNKINNAKIGKNVVVGLNVVNSPKLLFSLPGIILGGGLMVVQYALGHVVDKFIANAKNIADLTKYQYQLLLREFVFNALNEFTGARKEE